MGVLGIQCDIIENIIITIITVADLGGVLWVLQHPQLSPW